MYCLADVVGDDDEDDKDDDDDDDDGHRIVTSPEWD